MKTTSLKTDDPIVKRLKSVADAAPDLRVAARMYQAILPLIRDADIHIRSAQLDATTIHSCLEAGVPVLSCFEMEVNFSELEDLLVKLLRAVESIDDVEKKLRRWKIWRHVSSSDDFYEQSEYRSLSSAVSYLLALHGDNRLDLGEVLKLAASGDYNGFSEKFDSMQIDPNLLWTLAQHTLKPVLHRWRQEIEPLTNVHLWRKGYCFVCGSSATFGELQDNTEVKHLRCGQCGADWHYNRLDCLHCGNPDHATQKKLTVDDCDSRRIEACDMCGGYLKVITSFTPTPPEMLVVEDFASLYLDFVAKQHGYEKLERCKLA